MAWAPGVCAWVVLPGAGVVDEPDFCSSLGWEEFWGVGDGVLVVVPPPSSSCAATFFTSPRNTAVPPAESSANTVNPPTTINPKSAAFAGNPKSRNLNSLRVYVLLRVIIVGFISFGQSYSPPPLNLHHKFIPNTASHAGYPSCYIRRPKGVRGERETRTPPPTISFREVQFSEIQGLKLHRQCFTPGVEHT